MLFYLVFFLCFVGDHLFMKRTKLLSVKNWKIFEEKKRVFSQVLIIKYNPWLD